nr:antitoxin Xre/MbcA/ParS toxin-binding domain-containing protein [Mesorhizobium temperatum]
MSAQKVFALAKQPRLAWSWLVRPSPYLEGSVPIDLLRRDLVEEVVIAARRLF